MQREIGGHGYGLEPPVDLGPFDERGMQPTLNLGIVADAVAIISVSRSILPVTFALDRSTFALAAAVDLRPAALADRYSSTNASPPDYTQLLMRWTRAG